MTEHLHVKLPSKMADELEAVKTQTGLSKSEISRRGILNQIRELEDRENEQKH